MTDTKYLLSIDPGLSTGVVLLGYNDEASWLEAAWQFSGGVYGFLTWLANNTEDSPFRSGWSLAPTYSGLLELSYFYDDAPLVIAEKFNARATQGFGYTTDSLEPLRLEGAMIGRGLMTAGDSKQWRSPVLQYVVGGKDKADKKKRLHKFLKDSGFYVAPKDVGCGDADDVRSALGHGLAYLAREEKHLPTYELVTKWSETNV